MSPLAAKTYDQYTIQDWIDSYRKAGELPPGVDISRNLAFPGWRLDHELANGTEVWKRSFDGCMVHQFPCLLSSKDAELAGIIARAEEENPLPRREHDPDEPTIDLWSFQNPGFLDTIQEDGIVHGRHLDDLQDDSFVAPYLWMLGQMEKRLPRHRGHPPIWAYTHCDDLRTARWSWYTGGVWMLRLHLRVPVSAVLVSEYDAWHMVLNDWPHLTRAEDEAWDLTAEGMVDRGEARSSFAARKLLDHQRKEVFWKSWERIFDTDFHLQDPDWFGKDNTYQACIDGLQEEWVVDAKLYKTGTTNEDRKRMAEENSP